jgi:hypothetical protein
MVEAGFFIWGRQRCFPWIIPEVGQRTRRHGRIPDRIAGFRDGNLPLYTGANRQSVTGEPIAWCLRQ